MITHFYGCMLRLEEGEKMGKMIILPRLTSKDTEKDLEKYTGRNREARGLVGMNRDLNMGRGWKE